MVIAATQSDEVNMVACQVAHSIFAVPRKVARLRSKAYLDAIYADLYRRDHLPIDVVISPNRRWPSGDAAPRRALSLRHRELPRRRGPARRHLHRQDCAVINTPFGQLSELFSTLRIVVVGIRRAERLFVPEPTDQLFAEDESI